MKRFNKTRLYKRFSSCVHELLAKINPKIEMRRAYYKTFHRYPNLVDPKDLIEKIYWMQLNADTSMWTKCADKYAMRDYVKACGYESFLPENYGHWDKVKEIDFTLLPNRFVMKTNNGCGTVMIVRNKADLDLVNARKKLKRWLKQPYGWSGSQLHYTRIKPCVIAEELLTQDEEQKVFSPESMVDYKVWCINGEPENVLVVYGRTSAGYCLDLYDKNWNRMSDKLKQNGHFVFHEDIIIPKPVCLKEMLEMAGNIAKKFPEVRVDFYVVYGKPVIGELTFSTGYGYFTDEYYLYLGNKIDLDNLLK